jgi:hypothetical protein
MTEQTSEADKLFSNMEKTRQEWAEEDGEQDDTDKFLDQAIAMAVAKGKGWSPGEREEYMAKILDDDFLPPMFASTPEEMEKTGLAEAFSSLQYDDSPGVVMLEFKKKGTDAFMSGKRNKAKNVQYFRDAANNYYQAVGWAQRIEPLEHKEKGPSATPEKDLKTASVDPDYTEAELDEIKSNLYANAALAHLQINNWGHVRDDSRKVRIDQCQWRHLENFGTTH